MFKATQSKSRASTHYNMQPFVVNPTEYDILCGKDKTYAKHSGNQLFRSKIMSYTSIYKDATTKPQKMKLTKQIVNEMKREYTARFLRPVEHGGVTVWEEINDQQARDKTSHALRFALNGSHSRRKKGSVASSSESSVATAKRAKKKGKSSLHRRVNSDSTDATMLTTDSYMSLQQDDEEEDHQEEPEPTPVASMNFVNGDLFRRQQSILQNMNRDIEIKSSRKSRTRAVPDRCSSKESGFNFDFSENEDVMANPSNMERFDTLHSEDFNEFLDANIDCDWDNTGISNFTSL